MTTPPNHSNRLLSEKSPYLLQHAHNPVDWYPWGEAALARARQESRPIFLSIGYSTCHWCHVMERESFEDPAVAALLNAHFVAIKVDREERPDLDAVYMQAVMQMTGQGGWPLTVFLTPDLKPFYGGTYFPPEERWGRPGLKQVLTSVAASWKERPDRLRAAGDSLTQALQAETARAAAGTLAPEPVLTAALRQFTDSYDAQHGGFDAAPKFPRSHALSLLLRAWRRRHDPALLTMVEQTLQAMAAGGLYDQLGGGFHRYSTDARWRIPHFEKMLYDQALLATTYLEAYQATGRPEYAEVAREIFEYVLRDLTSPEGAFYSAEDADSAEDPARPTEKREGACYLWTPAQLEAVLGADDAAVIAFLYGVEPGGNAPDDLAAASGDGTTALGLAPGEFQEKSVLYRAHTVAEVAKYFKRPKSEITALLARARPRLFEARRARPRPHLDDKVLVDWNGLMIAAFAIGARVLEEPRYEAAAQRAADFLLARLVRTDGRLLHRYRGGDAAVFGMLDDYAFLIHGLIELYQTTFEPRYLTEATRLTGGMLTLFWDEPGGGCFLTGRDAEALLVRQKVLYDGAIPSGNSVAALDLLRLGRLTGTTAWELKAQQLFNAFAGMVTQHPTAYPQLLMALEFAAGPSQEIVLAGPPDDAALQAMRRVVRQAFVPNAVVVLHPPGAAGAAIEALVPWVVPQGMIQGRPAAYVCQSHVCRRPVTSADALKFLVASDGPAPYNGALP